MMRVFGSLMLIFLSLATNAQPSSLHANSWIDFSQPYYKLKVGREGVYKLTYQELKDAGIPVDNIDPRSLQLFHRGVQQAIHFQHNEAPANAAFTTQEYFEFFGRKNDGTRDAGLYQPASSQPHAYYNLFSDTTAYFLTWRPAVAGKRMKTVDLVNTNNIPKESYHNEELLSVFKAEYSAGATVADYVQQSFFDQGEGWTGTTICTQNADCGTGQLDLTFEGLQQTVQSASPPTLEALLVGRDDLLHRVEIYAGPNVGALRLVATQNFSYFETSTVNASLAWSDLSLDGKVVVRVKPVGVDGARDRVSLSYAKVRFAQGYDLSGTTEKKLRLNANPGGKSYIELANMPANARLLDITYPDSVAIIGTRINGSLQTAVVINSDEPRTLLVNHQLLTAADLRIERVSFRAIDAAQPNFIVVSHKSLMQPAFDFSDAVKAYAGYRASAEGGGYDTLTVSIDQLYNQFNYGEISPLAIREFMRYLVDLGEPRFLFLIGKGREVQDDFHRKTSLAINEFRDLVPTGGTPASDMVFTAGLSGQHNVAAVATGRLTASTPAQVVAYLNKVKESETNATLSDWSKKILHLSGGISAVDLSTFRSFMDGFATVARGTLLGAQVKTIGKHDPDPIQFIDISSEINAGTNLVTFFGHSGPNATDIDIGYVSDPKLGFNNIGRYPAFLVNGCSAGQFFQNGTNFGEDWMLAPNKGARAFIAHSSFGLQSTLRFYTQLFYQVAFTETAFINKGIGEIQKEVAGRILALTGSNSSVSVAQTHQMVLLGDPAIKLFPSSKPDFEVDNNSLSLSTFDGKAVHALADSIQLNIITKNRGLALDSLLRVKITHRFNDNTLLEYDSAFSPVLYEDTLRFVIRRGNKNFFGNNEFKIHVDAPDSVAEVNEGNNEAVLTSYIPFNGTKNLFPVDFGIVNSTDVELIFQNTDVLAEPSEYQLELDSTIHFNSPFLQQLEVSGPVLTRRAISLAQSDSTTYYWRTKVKNQPNAQWETTSFTYILNGSSGWGQVGKSQFQTNTFANLVQDATSYNVEYTTTSVDVFVRTFGSTSSSNSLSGSFQVNNSEYYFSPQAFSCRNNTINLVAFNKSTLVPYRGVPFTFSDSFGRACGKEPQIINSFLASETDTGNQDDLIQYVDNIHEGDSVVLFSMGDAGFANWSAQVKSKVGELGIPSSAIESLVAGEPVIILGKKGAPVGTAKIIRSSGADPTAQELQLSEELTGRIPEGSMRSTLIGPAVSWNSLATRFRKLEATDFVQIGLHGITRTGAEKELNLNVPASLSLEEVDANEFPYLRLSFHTSDEAHLTPAFVKNWVVLYEPAPEGIVVLHDAPAKEVQEGAPWSARFEFVNVSPATFSDSLRVDAQVFTQSTRTAETKQFRIKAPAPGDSTSFVVSTDSKGKIGLNDISLSVNRNVITELYYPNNSMTLLNYLNVVKDETNPVLDVTIDGRHVANGDYVSANPIIVARVRDENKFLMLRDTSAVSLFVRYPCEGNCTATPVYYRNNENLSFTVDAEKGELVVHYKPVDLANGLYELYVRATDASGNKSDEDFYRVDFKVSSETFIGFQKPYPNPSPGPFFFDWVVAGTEPPSSAHLQIFNSRGQLVCQFTESDMPAFRVGGNRLQWNALENDRKVLADGIYYYRFTIDLNGEEFSSSGRLLLLR